MPGLTKLVNIFRRNKFDKKAYDHVLGSSTSLPNMKSLLGGIKDLKEMDDLQKAVYILVKIIYELRDITESKNMMMNHMQSIDGSIEFKGGTAGVKKNLSTDVDNLFASFSAVAANNKKVGNGLKKVASDFGASGGLGNLQATEKLLFNAVLNAQPSGQQGSIQVSGVNEKEIKFEGVPPYERSSRGISLEAICNWLIDFLSVANIKLKNKDDDMKFFAAKNLKSNNGRPRNDLLTDLERQKDFFANLGAKLGSARDSFLSEKYSVSQKINRKSFVTAISGVLNALDVNIFSHIKGNPFVFYLGFDNLRADMVKAATEGNRIIQNIKSKSSAALKAIRGSSPTKKIGEKEAKVVSNYNENFLKPLIGLSEAYGKELSDDLVLSGKPTAFPAQVEDLKHISDAFNKISKETTVKQCKDLIQGALDHLRLEGGHRSLDRIDSMCVPVQQRTTKLPLILHDLLDSIKKIQKEMSGAVSSKLKKISVSDYPGLKAAISIFYNRTVGDLLFMFGKFRDKRTIKFVNFCLSVRRGKVINIIVEPFASELDWLGKELMTYEKKYTEQATIFNRGYGSIADTRSDIVENMKQFVGKLEKVK